MVPVVYRQIFTANNVPELKEKPEQAGAMPDKDAASPPWGWRAWSAQRRGAEGIYALESNICKGFKIVVN